MQIHEALANREAQARRVTACAESRFKDPLKILRLDPATGVGHFYQDPRYSLARFSPRRDFDLSAGSCVTDCVANQVQDDLTEEVFIPQNFEAVVSAIKGKVDTCLVRNRPDKLHAALHRCDQIDWSQMEIAAAVKIEDIVDRCGDLANSCAKRGNPWRIVAAVFRD